MATLNIKKGLLGREDISRGTGTVSRAKSDGTSQTITKVNLWEDNVFVVTSYGAKGDGVTDDTSKIQAAADAAGGNGILWFPSGTYLNTGDITLSEGQIVAGMGPKVSILKNIGSTFVFTCDLLDPDKLAPRIRDLGFIADNCIRFGDKSLTVANGSGQAPLVQGEISGCDFVANTVNQGTAIELTKVFDTQVYNNRISGYTRGILLYGSDINSVYDNRITGCYKFCIEEQSIGTFCSGNKIDRNDLLDMKAASATYFKSSSRHVVFRNNFLEDNGNGSAMTMVDCTATGQTTYGQGVPTEICQTMEILDNRIEMLTASTSREYNLHNDFRTLVLRGKGSTGQPATNASQFIGTISVFYQSTTWHTMISISNVPSFGGWNNYDGKSVTRVAGPRLIVTPDMVDAAYDSDQTRTNLKLGSDYWAISAAGDANLHWLRLDCDKTRSEAGNDFYRTGRSYRVTLMARSTVSGDGLRAAMGGVSVGEINQDFTLTDEFKPYSWVGAGFASGITNVGVHIALRTGATGELQIKSFTVEPLDYLEASFTYDPGSLADGAGETHVETVTGAAFGDFVLVSAPYDLQDIVVTGYVQAANTVEIRVQNESGGVVDLGSGTWKVRVLKA